MEAPLPSHPPVPEAAGWAAADTAQALENTAAAAAADTVPMHADTAPAPARARAQTDTAQRPADTAALASALAPAASSADTSRAPYRAVWPARADRRRAGRQQRAGTSAGRGNRTRWGLRRRVAGARAGEPAARCWPSRSRAC